MSEIFDSNSMYPSAMEKIKNNAIYGKKGSVLKNENKMARIQFVKEVLNKKDVHFIEKENGHLVIDGISFWATTETWYDPYANKRGKGVNSFLIHIQYLGYLK